MLMQKRRTSATKNEPKGANNVEIMVKQID